MVFSFLLSSLSLSSLFPFFPLASCIHTPNLETHFGFASIPSDESRLDQRLDAVVNRHVEVEDGGCKEKEKEEGNGLRGGGRRPTIRGKRLFDVASWTLAFGARSVPNFILFPAQPFVKHRRAAGKEFSPLGSSFVVQRTWRGDTYRMGASRGWIFARERHFSRYSCSTFSRFRSSSSFLRIVFPVHQKNPGTKMFLF